MLLAEILHKRVLLRVKYSEYRAPNVDEYKVLEVDPTNSWIKLMNSNGRKVWVPVSDISVVSILQDIVKVPKPVEPIVQPTVEDDYWQDNTGTQPVADDVRVDIILRDGKYSSSDRIAGGLTWTLSDENHPFHSNDIIKWRVSR